jgi:hypothetical protein
MSVALGAVRLGVAAVHAQICRGLFVAAGFSDGGCRRRRPPRRWLVAAAAPVRRRRHPAPPYFTATQVRSKMPPRAVAAAMRITFLALAAATALAATGAILDRSDVVAVGLISYALGLVVVAAILPIDTTRRRRRGGPRVDTNVSRPGWRSPISRCHSPPATPPPPGLRRSPATARPLAVEFVRLLQRRAAEAWSVCAIWVGAANPLCPCVPVPAGWCERWTHQWCSEERLSGADVGSRW